MKKFLNILSIAIVAMVGTGALVSCEDDSMKLGNNVIGGEADGNVKSLDVIAYNAYNNAETDTIRSDKFVLQNATLGAYKEPVFGTTTSKFYSQLRPGSSYIGNTDFGTNPVVDSVNLYIPVYYSTTKDPISKDTINLSNPGKKIGEADTIMITTKYAVDSIYGNKDLKMTLRVRDISTVLYSDSKYFSPLKGNDSPISVNSKIIGTATIGNSVENKIVKSGTTEIYKETVGYKVSLDKDYFNEKIIQNANNGLIGDYATFIRQNIKGFEFSVDEKDGFILNFNPNSISLNMYYSYKNPTDKTPTDTKYKERLSSSYGFDFTNVWNTATTTPNSNVLFNLIKNDYTGSVYSTVKGDSINGDSRLYLNGMSAANVIVKFNQTQINELKSNFSSKGDVIIGAKLKFFIDDKVSLPKPPYIVAWNNYKKDGKKVNELYSDVLGFYNSYPNSVHFNPIVKGDTNYYTIDITNHIKDMIEKGNTFDNQEMIVTMGNFITSVSDATTINSTNPYQNNRAYNPYRIVLHGNKSEVEAKKLKLLVYYATK